MAVLAKQLLAACCLASLGLGRCAGPPGRCVADASALVQREVRAHEGRLEAEALRSLGAAARAAMQGLSLQLAPAPSKPSRAILVSRSAGSLAEGNSAELRIADGCSATEDTSLDRCAVPWGTNVSVWSKVHVAAGIKKGDVVKFTTTVNLRSESASSGGDVTLAASCGLCDGQCRTAATALDGALEVSGIQPTLIRACDLLQNGTLQDLVMANFTIPVPPAPAGLENLSASLALQAVLFRADGSTKMAETLRFELVPPADASRPAEPAGLWAAPRALPPRPGTLPGALVELLGTTARLAASHLQKPEAAAKLQRLSAAKAEPRAPRKLNTLTLKLTVRNVENLVLDGPRANLSFSASSGCVAKEPAPSFSCQVPIGQPVNVSLGLHVGAVYEEGAFIKTRVEAKVGGMLGSVLGSILQPVEIRKPMCGNATDFVLLGMKLPMPDQDCGLFWMDLKLPAFTVEIPSLASVNLTGLPIPMLPKSLDEFPPVTITEEIHYKHQDRRPIADLKLEVGLIHKD